MMIKSLFKIFFSLLLFLVFALSTTPIALAATYNLTGTVRDSIGNTIDNATIEVFDVGTTNSVATITSGSSGNYSLSIEEGSYDIEVTPPGGSDFAPIIALNQEISGNKVLNV